MHMIGCDIIYKYYLNINFIQCCLVCIIIYNNIQYIIDILIVLYIYNFSILHGVSILLLIVYLLQCGVYART